MQLNLFTVTRAIALGALVLAVAACGLPRPGPSKSEIYEGSVQKQGDAFIVTVNDRVTRLTSVVPALGFSAAFQKAGQLGSDTIYPGDKLNISVYENVNDPLLGVTGQKVSALTNVEVDGQGFIFVPYGGRIKASGNSEEALRQAITRKLETQTPNPQVSITRLPGAGATVSVSGSVIGQGVFPIEAPTRTLAAMLARAGGISIPTPVALVRVIRGKTEGRIWLQDLYDHPNFDIALRNGDRIIVEKDTRAFSVLGATGQQSHVSFDTRTLSALEAIAQVGGLNSATADPKGIFVFRNEPADIANPVLGRTDLTGMQRMVYVLNLTEPNGMFNARDFVIRDGDTLYVTEAPFVSWQKSLSVLTGSVGAANQVSSGVANKSIGAVVTGH